MGVDIDELNLGWGEQLYVLLRPIEGSWYDLLGGNGWKSRNVPADWRPALIRGFQDEGERNWYGGINDQRRVYLIDSTYSHDLSKFEIGEILGLQGKIGPELEQAASPTLR